MNLKNLLHAVESELREAGHDGNGVVLSLAFTAKASPDGQVECEFVDRSSISRPQAGEVHYLKIPVKSLGHSRNRSGAEQIESGEDSSFGEQERIDSFISEERKAELEQAAAEHFGDSLLRGSPHDVPAIFRNKDEEQLKDAEPQEEERL